MYLGHVFESIPCRSCASYFVAVRFHVPGAPPWSTQRLRDEDGERRWILEQLPRLNNQCSRFIFRLHSAEFVECF